MERATSSPAGTGTPFWQIPDTNNRPHEMPKAADDLELSTPHQVFVMSPDAAEAGAGLDQARSVGWRFLVESGGEVIASAESPELPEGTGAPSFSEGQVVTSTASAVKAAQASAQVAKGGFELRLLQIPTMYLTALWLHSPNADPLIPLERSPIGDEGTVVPPPVSFRKLTEFARGWNPLGGATAYRQRRPLAPTSGSEGRPVIPDARDADYGTAPYLTPRAERPEITGQPWNLIPPGRLPTSTRTETPSSGGSRAPTSFQPSRWRTTRPTWRRRSCCWTSHLTSLRPVRAELSWRDCMPADGGTRGGSRVDCSLGRSASASCWIYWGRPSWHSTDSHIHSTKSSTASDGAGGHALVTDRFRTRSLRERTLSGSARP